MFRKFYSTQMSGGQRSLARRLSRIGADGPRPTKCLALVLTVFMLLTATGGSLALAALAPDGLEHWTGAESYAVAGFKVNIQVDMAQMPDWVGRISSNGQLHLAVDYIDTRSPTFRFTNAWPFDRSLSATITGNKGQTSITGGLSATTAELTHAFCNIGDDTKAFVLYMPLDAQGNITSYRAAFTTPGADALAFSHMSSHKESFVPLPINEMQFTGDFAGLLKATDYFSMPDFFGIHEQNFKNQSAQGINISVAQANAQGIALDIDVNPQLADSIQFCIRPQELLLTSGNWESYPLKEVNWKRMTLPTQRSTRQYYFAPSWTDLEPGRSYVVDIVLSRHTDDPTGLTQEVVYRQRQTVTIP